MSTNNFFSGKRFLRLLQHDFSINRKTYFWTLAGVTLVLFGINYFFLLSYQWKTKEFISQNYFFPFLLSITVMIYFVGTAFSELRDRIKTQNFLLLPASVFEKFLAQFVIRFVLFLPLMFLLFFVTTRLAKASFYSEGKAWNLQSSNYDNIILKGEITSASIFNLTNAEINYQPSQIPDFHFDLLLNQRKQFEPALLFIWSMAFVGLFVVFAGTTCFKRYGVVKSLVIIGVLSAGSGFATRFYNEYLIAKVGLEEWQKSYNDYFLNTIFRKFDGEFHPALFFLWMAMIIGLLLGFSYFKLKEKEA